jgi:hypothetical protein
LEKNRGERERAGEEGRVGAPRKTPPPPISLSLLALLLFLLLLLSSPRTTTRVLFFLSLLVGIDSNFLSVPESEKIAIRTRRPTREKRERKRNSPSLSFFSPSSFSTSSRHGHAGLELLHHPVDRERRGLLARRELFQGGDHLGNVALGRDEEERVVDDLFFFLRWRWWRWWRWKRERVSFFRSFLARFLHPPFLLLLLFSGLLTQS